MVLVSAIQKCSATFCSQLSRLKNKIDMRELQGH